VSGDRASQSTWPWTGSLPIGVLAVAAVGCSSPSIAFDAEDYSAVLRVVLPEADSLWPQPTDRGPNFWWSDRAHLVGILTESPYELPESYASHSTSACTQPRPERRCYQASRALFSHAGEST
jgi:hypothetical protein